VIDATVDRCCIVGAGPAGLSVADALKRSGIVFDLYERNDKLGGIWDIDQPDSPMYESACLISSRDQSALAGFPMPDNYPDYPGHAQILDYLKSFARERGLTEHIRFNCEVKSAVHDRRRWRVVLADGSEHDYRWLVCAPGANHAPCSPRIPGSFGGERLHAKDYRSPEIFVGKRVLIIGGGNSGCDIACDAARHADKAWISMRRGYHIVPKHVVGMPADEFAARSPPLPLRVRQWIMQLILRGIVGKPSRYGLPRPDHRLFESHPIVNTEILEHLESGRLLVRPDVRSFDGKEVVFADGSRESVDLVLMATGYSMSMPFLSESLFQWHGGRPELVMRLFHPSQDNLFVIGLVETNMGLYPLLGLMSHVISQVITDQLKGHIESQQSFDAIRQGPRPDLSGGIGFVHSDRHYGYVDARAYRRYLKRLIKRMGWPRYRPGCDDTTRMNPGEA